MYSKRQQVEVEIIDLGDRNQCFGRLEDGMAIFVQGPAAVGDVVTAEIFKIKKKYLSAYFRGIVRPSPKRTQPICRYFGQCGGCKWQHMVYPEQLRLKRKQVQDALEHIGGFSGMDCTPCQPASALFGYRNKMDFSFTDLRYLTSDESGTEPGMHDKPLDFALGFHAPGCFSKAIDIDHCDLSTPEMNQALTTVRSFCLRHRQELPIYSTHTHLGELRNLVVRHGGRTGEFMVNLVTSTHHPVLMQALCEELVDRFGDRLTTFINSTTSAKHTVAFGEQEYVLHGPGYISDRLSAPAPSGDPAESVDYTFRISANSFFQTNTRQAEMLYRTILEMAQLRATDSVLDLFCGTGSIALFASGHCSRVLGIELVESAVRDARENAARNGVGNCEFIQLDLKHLADVVQRIEAFGHPDVVITDPPRAGMHPRAVAQLLRLAPAAILYVSCNPASLARDGQMLCEGGAYRLVQCRPIDMFPQTNHVESVARFERTP